MKKRILIVAVILVIGAALAHWYYGDRGRFTTAPEYIGLARTVSGNDLISDHDPAAILRFAPAFRYLGGQKFILYGVADTEQHFFVETTADDRLKSVYWVQYEAYLPGKPYTYDYDDSPLRVQLGEFEFKTDTEAFAFDPTKKRRRGTDGAMVRQFLAGEGYAYPGEVAYARLVYLTDESRQKELMIIFMDDLEEQGLTAAELQEGGANAAHWPEVEQAHLDRIKETLQVLPLGSESETDSEADSTRPAPCSEAWLEFVEQALGTGDGQGHGPDLGSEEWKSVVEFRLGLRGSPHLPPRDGVAWCAYVDAVLGARPRD